MRKEINDNIEREIMRLLNELEKLDPLSDEYEQVSARLMELYGKELDEVKIQIQHDDDWERREQDSQQHNQLLQEKKKDRIVQLLTTGVTAVVSIAGLVAYGKWFEEGLEFEKTGTFSAQMTKNLFSGMRPRKKD